MQKLQTTNNDVATAEQCAEQLLEVIPPVMRRIKLLMREGRSEHLSVPEFRALGYISRHPDASLSAVAEHAGLSVPATSRLVDALVRLQLVERGASATDRRQIALRLTEQGSDRLAQTRQRTRGELAAMLVALSESERNDILRGLQPLRELFARAGEAHKEAAPGEDGIVNKEGRGWTYSC